MVPMLTCGLVRSNFAFATGGSSWTDFSAVLTAGLWVVRVCREPGDGLAAGGVYSPVALAMISLATLVGTSA